MWVAAAKDTDKPDQKPQKEWAKEDLAFGGGEGAARLMHGEESASKVEGDFLEERERLMTSHEIHDHDDDWDPGLPEAIELKEFGPDESAMVMQERDSGGRGRQDLL